MRIFVATAVLAALALPALADVQDPDTEVARRRFMRGAELYDQGRYAEAAAEFEAASRLRPAPQFDFNIGRCLDRLEHWGEAADAYERYATSHPPDEEDVRARVAVLRKRVLAERPAVVVPTAVSPPQRQADIAASTPMSAPPLARRWWLWTAVGGAVVAGVAVGVGVGVTHGGDRFPPTTDGVYNVRWP